MIFPNHTISALKTYYQRECTANHEEEIEANDNVCRKSALDDEGGGSFQGGLQDVR